MIILKSLLSSLLQMLILQILFYLFQTIMIFAFLSQIFFKSTLIFVFSYQLFQTVSSHALFFLCLLAFHYPNFYISVEVFVIVKLIDIIHNSIFTIFFFSSGCFVRINECICKKCTWSQSLLTLLAALNAFSSSSFLSLIFPSLLKSPSF